MAKRTPTLTCPKCSGIAEYDMNRGCYRCPNCFGKKTRVKQGPTVVTTHDKPPMTCPRCSGPAEFDAQRGSYRCPKCSGPRPVQERGPEVSLAELERRCQTKQARQVFTQTCKSCGAQVEIASDKPSAECLLCGRHAQGQHEPSKAWVDQWVIDFTVTPEAALTAMRSHLRGLWLRPTVQIASRAVRQVHVPFWAYDVQVYTDWNANALVEVERSWWQKLWGEDKILRQQQMSGERSHRYDDWLVCASQGVPEKVVRQLEPFHTQAAHEGPVDGPLEMGTLGPRQAWPLAQAGIRRHEFVSCRNDIKAREQIQQDHHLRVAGAVEFDQPTGKSMALPLYIFSTKTVWGPMQVVVNGETGQVGSNVPYSLVKLIPVAFMALLLLTLIGVITCGGAFLVYAGLAAFAVWQTRQDQLRDEETFLDAG
ncbi:MAG: hypothetical protein KC910_10140 [Candidatus Eremiobacteraeota bacterium]|nr:hypothetical protein [Candidatus Eremiobacteraeota bacterium]